MTTWTNPEKKLLKDAVKTGRTEGLKNQQIIKRLKRDALLNNHTEKGIEVMISKLCPKYRQTKRTSRRGGRDRKYNRLARLMEKREELIKNHEKTLEDIKAVEAQIDGIIKN